MSDTTSETTPPPSDTSVPTTSEQTEPPESTSEPEPSSSEPEPEPSSSSEDPPPPSSSEEPSSEPSSDPAPPPSSSEPPPEPSSSDPGPSPSNSDDPGPSTTDESSSEPPSTTSQEPSTSVPPQTTVVETTIIVTGSDGSQSSAVETQTTVIGSVEPSDPASNSGASSSDNTGAIVGGVVGGVVALALLGVLAWFLLRRAKQKRLERDFDGNFDPTRFARPTSYGATGGAAAGAGGTLPNVGPTDDDDGMGGRLEASTIGGGVVAPYSLYQPTNSSVYSNSPPRRSVGSPPPMSQISHGGSYRGPGGGGTDASTTSSGYTPYNPYSNVPPQMAMPTPLMAGGGAAMANRMSHGPGSESSHSRSHSSGRPLSSKEAEAYAYAHQQQPPMVRYSVVNPDADMPTAGGSGAGGVDRDAYLRQGPQAPRSPTHSNSVLVHQDGGRIPDGEDAARPDEIPPTYDSLLTAAGASSPPQKR